MKQPQLPPCYQCHQRNRHTYSNNPLHEVPDFLGCQMGRCKMRNTVFRILQLRSHPTRSPISTIHFLYDVMKVGSESWSGSAKSIRAATRSNTSAQSDHSSAVQMVDHVWEWIAATSTQKQENLTFACTQTVWHISFRHDCRL